MKIFVRSVTDVYWLDVSPDDFLWYVKGLIFEKEDVDIFFQRILWRGRILGDDFASLREYGITHESTIEVITKIPSRHIGYLIQSQHPLPGSMCVHPASPISVTFKYLFMSFEAWKNFEVEVNGFHRKLEGVTFFDPNSITVNFVPKGLLPFGEELEVRLDTDTLSNQVSGANDHGYISWKFKTIPLEPVRIFLRSRENENENLKKPVTLERRSSALFSELLHKTFSSFAIREEDVKSFFFSGTDVLIEDDVDVSQIEMGDVIEVCLKEVR